MPAGERVPALNGTFAGVGEQEALSRLVAGEIRIRGRLADASNATLYATVGTGEDELACVYKPVSGERPLWDFPDETLARREVASYAVSATTGWHVVPPTVFRDGPLGPGSVQLWLQQDGADPADAEDVVLPAPGAGLIDIVGLRRVEPGWHTVLEAEDGGGRPVALVHADDLRLRRIAILDVVLNNADRKGGHVLPGWSGAVHGVDHGLTFHVEPKLRTVLWGFGGQRLLAEEREVLAVLVADLDGPLGELLEQLLTVEEAVATLERAERLLREDRLPRPRGHRTIPWPPF
ncbi:SCO1664 family protein [Kineococcus rhizosphaerae]|uniref:Putative repeat protein (TIGR03843 family) n=1 Tax=Kineococcus rhizosphaerae TaxID=559628 RepID=A0A2T0RA84_9ACTN|nr:SCO1664 family protein [Kineococcus rhizosphaerae]PRY18075.1 putative repeat protein (TIGR03843 family) [Kineococcus rhizosphaerae]